MRPDADPTESKDSVYRGADSQGLAASRPFWLGRRSLRAKSPLWLRAQTFQTRLFRYAMNTNAKRIILAGGSGFLGQALAAHFLNAQWEVVILSRDPNRAG